MDRIAGQTATRGIGCQEDKGAARLSGASPPAEGGAGTWAAGRCGDTGDKGEPAADAPGRGQ